MIPGAYSLKSKNIEFLGKHIKKESGSGNTKEREIRRIISKVQKEDHVLHGPVLLEILLEKAGCLHVHPHGRKHNRKILLACIRHTRMRASTHEPCLSTDLSCYLHIHAYFTPFARSFLFSIFIKDTYILPISPIISDISGHKG